MIGEEYFEAHRRECSPADIAALPNIPGVFLAWADEGAPYLARTGLLRRRLLRLFGTQGKPSRLLNLTGVVKRIEYWLCGSRLETGILHYALARRHFPEQYLKITKLRMPAYVKLTLGNPFPRTLVTNRIAGKGLYVGPFRSRASAELFNAQTLDLFQVRRCEENLDPNPDHPGCMYGEMNMCLRPCQAVVTTEEYSSEAVRLQHFFETGGASMLTAVAAARERSSELLDFEEAARQHKRYERVEGVARLRDELVCDIDRLCGLAITPAASTDAVALWFVSGGRWALAVDFPFAASGGEIVPLDRRLREMVARVAESKVAGAERQEHLALLARWYYSSWRDGEWLAFGGFDRLPYRRAVNAIARISRAAAR